MAKVRKGKGRVVSKGKKPPEDGITRPKMPKKTALQKRLSSKK